METLSEMSAMDINSKIGQAVLRIVRKLCPNVNDWESKNITMHILTFNGVWDVDWDFQGWIEDYYAAHNYPESDE